MEPRRNPPRSERRRRVLIDESRNDAHTPRIFREPAESPRPPNRYTNAALQALQAPIAGYLPLRRRCLLLWFLAGCLPIAGLNALDQQSERLAPWLGPRGASAFQLTSSGNLADWLASITFALAVIVMLAIYSVRMHRRDDYRARFTIWRSAIGVAVFVSIDATAGLRHAWQGMCESLTGTPLWGDGSVWWVGAWSIALGGMLLRLLLEMRASTPSLAAAIACSMCYSAAACLHLKLAPGLANTHPAIAGTLVLCGHHLLLFSLVLYARRVILEASGQLPSQSPGGEKKTGAREQPKSPKARPNLKAITGEDEAPEGTGKEAQPAVQAADDGGEPANDADDPTRQSDSTARSKAERKRSRREQKKRRAA